MEVEDPMSAKFRSLVETLMVKTTSEIVKVFAEVLLETRMEISRSWREIDELKQKLEESEEQRAEAIFISEATCNLKKEKEEMRISHQIAVSDTSMKRPEDQEGQSKKARSKNTTISENTTINENSEDVQEPATSQTPSPDMSETNPSVHSPNKDQEAQMSSTDIKRKKGCSAKLLRVTEHQTSETTEASAKSNTVVTSQQSPSNTGIIILGKKSGRKGAVVTRRSYVQKKHALGRVNTHTLRDRQLLSSQRHCLCCPSDQCSQQLTQSRISSLVSPRVYTCRKCGKKFKEFTQFKAHKCSNIYECHRCGQTFTELKNLSTHRRSIHQSFNPFPYCCYLCDQKFATQCGWSMHKRFHSYSDSSQNVQEDTPNTSQSLVLPKELKAMVKVRLERISDAQLEAALSPKGFTLHSETSQNLPTLEEKVSGESTTLSSAEVTVNTPVPSKESGSQTMTRAVKKCLDSSSPSKIDESIMNSDDETENSVPTASCQIQPGEKTASTPLNANTAFGVKCDEGSSSANEDWKTGTNSSSKKRKMSDCDHDAYNGLFPVEKILGWRNTKGQNEVRVKWMPCSLCGAKWKNTWEPAESFTSYKDSRNEDHGNIDKAN